MFTGIIETIGTIKSMNKIGTNLQLQIQSKISRELKIDQSVAHNGACLTVIAIENDTHTLDLIQETLSKTNFGNSHIGDQINLERCLEINGRLDGHWVQGHIDTTAKCVNKKTNEGSISLCFEFDRQYASLLIEKGSVTIQGVSLTCFNVTHHTFEVAIIPYTISHTNLNQLEINSMVNIEFDMIGKYINRINQLNK